MVAVAFIIGSLFFIPWIPDALRAVPDLTTTERWWIFHLVVGGTLIPHVVWFTVLRNLRANETAVAMYLVPLYTVIASFLVLGERLRPVAGFGGLAIIVGVLLAQTRRQHPGLERPSQSQAGATGDPT
jgi:drug/metabolite transporter (DMT)-like permease